MKHLELKSPHFKFLLGKNEEWMKVEKYKPLTVEAYSQALQEFFYFVESQGILHIRKIEQKHLTMFKSHLQTRANWSTKNGGIRNITINSIIKGVNCFTKHVNQSGEGFTLDIYEDYLPVDTTEKIILTTDEVMSLYNATFEPYPNGNIEMGQRDRVMIAIFYGCGLRLNEGRNLDVSDIDFQNRKIHVRFGKGKKERYVPIPNKHFDDIFAYIQQGREWFRYHHYSTTVNKRPVKKDVSNSDEDALFLNERGGRLKSFQHRLDFLTEKTGVSKKVGTHCLRHSVATHLILNEWKLEQVSKLLGHASIDSTQIYTHIAEQLINYNEKRNNTL